MKARIGNPIADDFLARVGQAARDLPSHRRADLLDDLEGHLREAVAEADGDEARLRTLVDSLGTPDEIVAAAGPTLPPKEITGRDLAAVILLLLGGFAMGVGWLVGVVMLWASTAWSTGQKLLGTLIIPGGLVLPIFLVAFLPGQVCSGGGTEVTVNSSTGVHTVTRAIPVHCSGTSFPNWLALLLVVAIVVGPIATAIYLVRAARRPRTAPA
jgi:hypothetical protein